MSDSEGPALCDSSSDAEILAVIEQQLPKQSQITGFFSRVAPKPKRGRPAGSVSFRKRKHATGGKPKKQRGKPDSSPPATVGPKPRISQKGQKHQDYSQGEPLERLKKALSDWEKKEGDCDDPKMSLHMMVHDLHVHDLRVCCRQWCSSVVFVGGVSPP